MAEGDLPAVADEAPAAAPPVSSPPAPSPGTRIARPRTRYPRVETVARQLGTALITLLVISIVTFAATNIKSPTDVARNALGRETSEAQLQAYVREHGLDKPIYARYGNWLKDFVQGNWGVSAVTGRDVRSNVVQRLLKTLTLALVAL